MTTHELKTLPEYFLDICSRSKNFELRKNDRNYKVGDHLILKEFDGEKLTGNQVKRTITYILDDVEQYGLMNGFCIMGLE
jgi:hypothetical protein